MTTRLAAAKLLSLAPALLLAGCVSSGPMPDKTIVPMPPETAPQALIVAPPAIASAQEVQVQPAPSAPIALHLDEAVLMALENNRLLSVQRLQPEITATRAKEAAGAFDPVFNGTLSFSRVRSTRRAGTGEARQVTEALEGAVGVREFLPTGTTISFDLSALEPYQRPGGSPFTQARAGVSVTQSLLRGFGTGPNLASLRQARLDVRGSEYELRGFAETLAADVEFAYWDYALAQQQLAIFTDSLTLAERQLKQTEDRIAVGTLAATERAAAQAEVARRREALINVRSTLESTRLNLLRLLNLPGGLAAQVELLDQPALPDFDPLTEAVSDHVALAMKLRPELNEARLRVQRGDLELVRTRNGLLPQLDFFATLGSSGYARSLNKAADRVTRGNYYDLAAGLSLEIPGGNRAARAAHERATLTREQSARALDNLAQLVEMDVRLAWIDVLSTREQVAATAATRQYQQEVLRAEEAKFAADKSTSFLVAQAQRDLVAAQVLEVVARVACQKSLTDLYRLEGSLLERRRIAAPGAEPPGEPR